VVTANSVWRVGFVLPAPLPPQLLEALELRADAVSLVVHETDVREEPRSWRVFLYFSNFPDLEALRAELAQLLAPWGGLPDTLATTLVPGEDWVRAATMARGPLRVGGYFVHGAADRERLPEDAIGIEIEAGLAFGTGEHESTRGCLLALDWLASRRLPERILDLGTGSGILAIAAARTWPGARVLAIDSDPLAVRVARANVEQNGVAARVEVQQGSGYAGIFLRRRAPFDLVLANLLAEPLIDLARGLRDHLAPGGMAVLSGMLDRQAEAVLRAHRVLGFRLWQRFELEPWVTLLLRRPYRRLARSRLPSRRRLQPH